MALVVGFRVVYHLEEAVIDVRGASQRRHDDRLQCGRRFGDAYHLVPIDMEIRWGRLGLQNRLLS